MMTMMMMIIIIIMKVIRVTIGATGTISNQFRKYPSNTQKSSTWRNYRQQPHWALHTHFVKY
jgi:hypothetical protein